MPLSVFFIILSVLLFLSGFLFLPVTLVFQGCYRDNFVLKLHIRFFGLKIKSLQLYPGKKKRQRRGAGPRREKFLKLLRRIETALFVKCCVGLSDAAATAISVGILQGVFNAGVAIVDNFTNLKKQQIEIEPSFNKKCFVVNALCIARTSVGNIILGILHYKK